MITQKSIDFTTLRLRQGKIYVRISSLEYLQKAIQKTSVFVRKIFVCHYKRRRRHRRRRRRRRFCNQTTSMNQILNYL